MSMLQWASNPIRRILSAILAVSLSICCCQTDVLLAGTRGCDAPCLGGLAEVTPGCCPSDRPTDPDDQDDERPAPVGCQVCCIKGTGLKDGLTVLPRPVTASIPTVALPTAALLPDLRPIVAAPRVDVTRLRIEPRTLVRLHCALLV